MMPPVHPLPSPREQQQAAADGVRRGGRPAVAAGAVRRWIGVSACGDLEVGGEEDAHHDGEALAHAPRKLRHLHARPSHTAASESRRITTVVSESLIRKHVTEREVLDTISRGGGLSRRFRRLPSRAAAAGGGRAGDLADEYAAEGAGEDGYQRRPRPPVPPRLTPLYTAPAAGAQRPGPATWLANKEASAAARRTRARAAGSGRAYPWNGPRAAMRAASEPSPPPNAADAPRHSMLYPASSIVYR